MIVNIRDTLRYRHTRETDAIRECRIPDARHAFYKLYAAKWECMRVFILRGFARGGCMLKYGIVRFCYKKCYTAGFNLYQ